MFDDFSDRARKVLSLAREQVQEFHHEYIGTEHLLLALARQKEGVVAAALRSLSVTAAAVRQEIERLLPKGPEERTPAAPRFPFTPRAQAALEQALVYRDRFDAPMLEPEHLLLGLVHDEEGVATQLLRNLGVDLPVLREEIYRQAGIDPKRVPGGAGARGGDDALNRVGVDVTALAAAGESDPVVGRHREIERLGVILTRRVRNCPVLVGPAGVGKSAVVQGFALAIARREAPVRLRTLRVRTLELAQLALEDRAEVDRTLAAAFERAREARDIAFLADDLFRSLLQPHVGRVELAESVLAHVLADQDLRLVVTALPDEYERVAAAHGSVLRRFVAVPVAPLSEPETLAVLHGLRPVLERDYGVSYADAALEACVRLAHRLGEERSLSERAIDLMDEAGARARLHQGGDSADSAALEAEIRAAKRAKDEAIAKGEFETAAREADRARALGDRRDALLRDHRQRPDAPTTRIDERAVEETLALIQGGRPRGA